MKELLAELFDRYHQDVYTYLYRLCHDVSLAEDLTSEVFVEVVRSIAAFRGRSDIKTWMFSIARHQWYQHLRRKKRQIPTESLHDLYDSHFTGLQSPDLSGEVEQAVHELLSSESELTRRVFRITSCRISRRLPSAAAIISRFSATTTPRRTAPAAAITFM